MSAVAATVAQAETAGPLWIVGAGGTPLAEGKTRAVRSINVSKTFILKAEKLANIVCTTAENEGFLLGGKPGTDYTKVIFKGCAVEGHTGCTAKGLKPLAATNSGEVIVDALTILAYPDGQQAGTGSALDLFASEGEAAKPNLFVQFKLEGTLAECGVLRNQEVAVEATGTEIEIKSEKRKCGQVAQVGEINATKEFRLSKAGEVAEKGALNFVEKLNEKEVEYWNKSTEKFELIKCGLSTAGNPSEEIGLSEIKTNPAEPFGWNV
jgi:hypothetical protein